MQNLANISELASKYIRWANIDVHIIFILVKVVVKGARSDFLKIDSIKDLKGSWWSGAMHDAICIIISLRGGWK